MLGVPLPCRVNRFAVTHQEVSESVAAVAEGGQLMTKPIIFAYLLLPAWTPHVILNGLGDPRAGSELLGEYGFTDESVRGNSLRSAAELLQTHLTCRRIGSLWQPFRKAAISETTNNPASLRSAKNHLCIHTPFEKF